LHLVILVAIAGVRQQREQFGALRGVGQFAPIVDGRTQRRCDEPGIFRFGCSADKRGTGRVSKNAVAASTVRGSSNSMNSSAIEISSSLRFIFAIVTASCGAALGALPNINNCQYAVVEALSHSASQGTSFAVAGGSASNVLVLKIRPNGSAIGGLAISSGCLAAAISARLSCSVLPASTAASESRGPS
jgi:hypothetical protein